MCTYEKGLEVLEQLFAKDCQFALATVCGQVPSVRVVDTFYDALCFYVVTYADSRKVQEIEANPEVALCSKFYSFGGRAYNIGHPLAPKNGAIREKLIKAFESWYFEHNDESDARMCYLKIELTRGFFYAGGTGYRVDFVSQACEALPFDFDPVVI